MNAYPMPHSDPTAVVGSRVGAYIVDAILMAIATLAILVPLFLSVSVEAPAGTVDCGTLDDQSSSESFGGTGGIIGAQPRTTTQPNPSFCFETGDNVRYIPEHKEGAFQRDVWITYAGISALNLVVLQGLTGASLGKLALGLRVVRTDGGRLGIGRTILRWILLFVDSFCCVLPGLVMVASTKGHRRIGDMAADSYVVKRGDAGRPVIVEPTAQPQGWGGSGFGAPQGSPGASAGWPTSPSAPPSPGGSWGQQSPPPSAASTPSSEAPTWDPARNAYIQYDREVGAWMQWDDETRTWGPISQ